MSRDKIEINEAAAVQRVSKRERELNPSIPGAVKPVELQPEVPAAIVPPAATEPEYEPEPVREQEVPREEPKRRRGKAQDYKSLFVKEVTGGKARVNKVVYIRKEHHDRILKVVQIIGKNEVSLFSFLDNVLEHHFSTFQGELNELYENSIDKNF